MDAGDADREQRPDDDERAEGDGSALHVEVVGEVDRLPAAVDLAAYRIVGEAVTNALRHAGASRCTVRLAAGPDALEVVVDDDGLGPGEVAGTGRRSMAERAAELGGSCTVGAGPEGGTRVAARLPAVRDGWPAAPAEMR
ncbi:MAG: sensor histidine kinase [Pseudonocardia sp.]